MQGLKGKIYLVGGAVRDELLGLPVLERDWVVVGSTPEEMLAAGYRRADEDFPVFLHPQTGEEYALARRETKVAAGYRGFRVDASVGVTLAEDLARRDFTINALARDARGMLIDLFEGEHDLHEGRLRHITPAFVEDPVRILRAARFAAKLGDHGFRLAHATHRLMKQMVRQGAVSQLRPERIGQEFAKSLQAARPWRFFEVLHACGALAELLPCLAGELAGDTAHAAADQAAPIRAMRQACQLSKDPQVRFAALMLGTGDTLESIEAGLRPGRSSLELLQAARRALALLRCSGQPGAQQVLGLLDSWRAWHQEGRFQRVLSVLQANAGDAIEPRSIVNLRASREAALSIRVDELKARGLSGARLGEVLRDLRIAAIAAAWTDALE